MSSTNAVVTIPNQLAYAVSKGGVAQLTKVMAMGLAPHDIRVNAIGPGVHCHEDAGRGDGGRGGPADDPVADADGAGR